MYLELDKHNQYQVAAIDSDGCSITYKKLCENIKRAGNILLPRSIVFLLCENSVGAVNAYLSCIENKVVPLILSVKTDKLLLKNLMEIYKPAYLWLPSKIGSKFSGDVLLECYGYSLIKTQNKIYPIFEDLAMLLSTSGSTGSPKLVRHSYKNLISNAKNVAKFFEINSSDRPLVDLPIFYTMGHSVICSHLYAGATLFLTSLSLLDKKFWDFFEQNRITTFTGVPYSYEILKRLKFTEKKWPFLKILTQGGGKLRENLYIEFAEYALKNNIKFIPTFGQTECTARMAYLSPDKALKKISSIGNAIPEGKMFLFDSDEKIITDNNIEGELGYKGPNVTLGYAENIEDLRKGDEWNGKILTGDIAIRDDDDCYYIIGRKKRFLKLFGYRVSLDQCEKLIKNEFNIECVCVGDDAVMLVYVEEDIDLNMIKRYLSEKTGIVITAFKVIKIPNIPRNEYGKIEYSKLNEREN